MIEEPQFLNQLIEGSSKFKLDGSFVYVKHPSIFEQSKYSEVYQDYLERGIARKLMTNDEADAYLVAEGIWREEDEAAIKEIKDQIEEKKDVSKSTILASKKISINREISKLSEKLSQIEYKKESMRPMTAEMFASLKVNDFIVINSFFKEPDCQTKCFDEDFYEEAERSYIQNLNSIYSQNIKPFSEDNIKDFVLSDFFSPFFSLYSGPDSIFGRQLYKLTKPQLVTCFYIKLFKNIFENIPKIPKDVAKDANALLEYAENYDPSSGTSVSRRSKARDADVGGTIIFGATQEDLEALKRPNETVVDGSKLVEMTGGSGRLNDMLETLANKDI